MRNAWKRVLVFLLVFAMVFTSNGFSNFTNVFAEGEKAVETTTEAKKEAATGTEKTTESTTEAEKKTEATTETDKTTASEKKTTTTEAKKGEATTASAKATTQEATTTAKKKTTKAATPKVVSSTTNLNQMINSATFSTSSMRPNQAYDLSVSFKENPEGLQFADSETMTYTLPDGLVFAATVTNQQFTIPVKDEPAVDITGNTYSISGNKITVNFNTQNNNFDRLTACANAAFQLQATVKLKDNPGDSISVNFGDGTTHTITVDNKTSVTIKKDGNYNSTTGQFDYTVTVTSKGSNREIVITDVIAETSLQRYDTNNFNVTATSNKGTVSGTLSDKTSTSFKYTIPTMQDGEVITLRYSADIDKYLGGMAGTSITKDESLNKATVNSKNDKNVVNDPSEDYEDFAGRVSTDWLKKEGSAGTTFEESGNTYRTVNWTLTVNADKKACVAGKVIKDTIPSDSRSVMQYSGTGISISKDGGAVSTKAWSTVGVTGATDYDWAYTIPASETGNHSYVITYTTKVDITGKLSSTYVKNNADFNDGQDNTGDIGIGVGGVGDIHCWKDLESYNSEKTTWKVDLLIPAAGLNKCVVTDQLPSAWINNKELIDEYDAIVGDIQGLVDGETCTASVSADKKTVTFTFKNGTQEGLKAQSNERRVYLYYTTKNNKEWVNSGQYTTHNNKTKLLANTTETGWDDANVTLEPAGINKDGQNGNNVTIDGVSYPTFTYSVLIKNPTSDTITINDEFETKYLKYYDQAGVTMLAGNSYDASKAVSGGTAAATATDKGIQLVTSNLTKMADGTSYYQYYLLQYTLIVKDAAALQALNIAAANATGNKVTLANSATWGTLSSSKSLEYTNNPLHKEIAQWPGDNNNNTVTYRITFNENKVKYNSGNNLTLTDELSNTLRLKEDDEMPVKIYKNDSATAEAAEYSYDKATNVVTLSVPDATKVKIEYEASIIGTGNITYTNDVKVQGMSSSANTGNPSVTVSTSGSGSASNPYIYLKKVSYTSNSKKLAGAVFQLFAEGNPVKDKDDKNVTFETGSDGTVKIQGNMNALGWTLIDGKNYTLKEITPPTGYLNENTEVNFKVGENATDTNTYTYGSTVTVSNAKVNFQVVKVDSEDSTKKLSGAGFTLYKDADCKDVAVDQQETGTDGIVSFQKLTAGTYYLKETKTPANYKEDNTVYPITINAEEAVSSDKLTFTANSAGLYTANVENTKKGVKAKFSKIEMGGSTELIGATLTITDNDKTDTNGKNIVVDSWTSTKDIHEVQLEEGNYTLTETGAPTGYAYADSIVFSVTDGHVKINGTNQAGEKVTMTDNALHFNINKTDITGEAELEGAVLKVYKADAEGRKDGDALASWTSKKNETHDFGSVLTAGTGTTAAKYVLVEEVAADGYTCVSNKSFSVAADGTIQCELTTSTVDGKIVYLVKDELSKVKFSKKDVNGTDELAGATLKITDKDGNPVEDITGTEIGSWVSKTTPTEITGLKDGDYKLVETLAPSGYDIADSVDFTIENGVVKDNTANTVSMTDNYNKVSIKKMDINGTKEVPGATLEITDTEGNSVTDVKGETIASWTSGESAHEIEGLKDGTYILKETGAPTGYAYAEDITFTVKDGKVVKGGNANVDKDGVVVMKDKALAVHVNKTDASGEKEVAGATIKLYNAADVAADGTIASGAKELDSWLSAKDVIYDFGSKVEAGKSYTLVETNAPAGYAYTAAITFSIANNGDITCANKDAEGTILVKDSALTVDINKTDATGDNEVAGAEIAVYDAKDVAANGSVNTGATALKTWTSKKGETGHFGDVVTAGNDYVIVETGAPAGYAYTANIPFSISKDGTVECKNKDENGVILVKDEGLSVKVNKKDATGQKEVADATVAVYNKADINADGTIKEGAEALDSWTSVIGSDHDFGNVVTAGNDYVLVETGAPTGYAYTANIEFSIDKTGKVTSDALVGDTIVVKDTALEVNVNKMDASGKEEVAGATIELYKEADIAADGSVKKDAKALDKWESVKGEAHNFGSVVEAGKGYVLVETGAPQGYAYTTNISFTIDKDGKVNTSAATDKDGTILVKDEALKVNVNKMDASGEKEVAGATIKLYATDKDGKQTGEALESWISAENVIHDFGSSVKAGETYVLVETNAPEGFGYAADIVFTVEKDGTITPKGNMDVDDKGTILIKDGAINVNVNKTDISGKEEVAGAIIKLYKESDINTDGTVKTGATALDSWTSEKGKTHNFGGKVEAGNAYVLVETNAPAGYAYTTNIPFSVDAEGAVTCTADKDANGNYLMKDEALVVNVNKTDVSGKEEVAGATIKLYNAEDVSADGTVKTGAKEVDTWTSVKGENHNFGEKAEAGKDYVLVETNAPTGYAYTAVIPFSIAKNGTVSVADSVKDKDGTILVKDEVLKVNVNKVDASGEKEIPGATIELYEADEDGKPSGDAIDTWVSAKDEVHDFGDKIEAGKDYVLVETNAPDGYAYTADITFTVEKDGTITTDADRAEDGTILVKDEALKVNVNKTNITGDKEVAGATIKLYKADDILADGSIKEGAEALDSWVSAEHEVHDFAAVIKADNDYVLVETGAPTGYKYTANIPFNVAKDGTVTSSTQAADGTILVKDEAITVNVNKMDVSGEKEVAGAKISLYNAADVAEDGTVSEGAKALDTWTSVEGSSYDFGPKVDLEGSYVLVETGAPSGYAYTANIPFSITKAGEVVTEGAKAEDGTILFKDETTKVTFSKTDITGQTELAGAVLTVKDSKGNVVETWTSTTDKHVIEGKLNAGETYTLTEVTAPAGYSVAENITFTVNRDGKVVDAEGNETVVTMKDAVAPTTEAGKIVVTKLVTYELKYQAVKKTFYCALFSDAELTKKVSDVKELKCDGTYSTYVVFDQLVNGTYYVAETDETGAVVGTSTTCTVVGNGTACTISDTNKTTGATIENQLQVPDEDFLYDEHDINVTKTVTIDDEDISEDFNGKFYVSLFSDPYYTTRIEEPLEIDIVDGESTTVSFTGLPAGSYYVVETDEAGTPVDSSTFGFDVTYDGETTVSSRDFTSDDGNKTINLNNNMNENHKDYEKYLNDNDTPDDEDSSSTSTSKKSSKGSKTGDNTHMFLYLAFALGAAGIGYGEFRRRRSGRHDKSK